MVPLEFLQLEYKNNKANAQEAKPRTNTKKLNSKTQKDIPFRRQSQLLYWNTIPLLCAHLEGIVK